jgi:hypothetical protein
VPRRPNTGVAGQSLLGSAKSEALPWIRTPSSTGPVATIRLSKQCAIIGRKVAFICSGRSYIKQKRPGQIVFWYAESENDHCFAELQVVITFWKMFHLSVL